MNRPRGYIAFPTDTRKSPMIHHMHPHGPLIILLMAASSFGGDMGD